MAELTNISNERSEIDRKSFPRVALTMGDPNGIGPEVVLKCLADEDLYTRIRPVVVGSLSALSSHAAALKMSSFSFVEFKGQNFGTNSAEIVVRESGSGHDLEIQWGELTRDAGAASIKAVDMATDMCLSRAVDAMVTAPLSKQAVAMAGYEFNGHTGHIAKRCSAPSHIMMMVSDKMRVGLVTGHIAVSRIGELLSTEVIVKRLTDLSTALETDFGIESPSIAVLGLNPHAGEDGLLGEEEKSIITPAIEWAQADGIDARGPFAADGFFGTQGQEKVDAVLAMYHDQGLIPFKALSFESGVNYTAGLSIVRTSPDHGTAFGIAGKGNASHGSMKHAVYLASQIAERRIRSEGPA